MCGVYTVFIKGTAYYIHLVGIDIISMLYVVESNCPAQLHKG